MASAFNSVWDVAGFALFIALLTWAFWKVWQQGVRQAEDFDRQERRERSLCPECGYDLRGGGHERCPECGASVGSKRLIHETPPEAPAGDFLLDPRKLSSDWPADEIEPRPPGPGAPMVVLHATRLYGEAELLQKQLLARGVWCRLEERREYVQAGVVAARVSQWGVLVAADEAERAAAVVERFRLKDAE